MPDRQVAECLPVSVSMKNSCVKRIYYCNALLF